MLEPEQSTGKCHEQADLWLSNGFCKLQCGQSQAGCVSTPLWPEAMGREAMRREALGEAMGERHENQYKQRRWIRVQAEQQQGGREKYRFLL